MKNSDNTNAPFFTVQWHVTALCDQACQHCYMVHDRVSYEREIRNELSLENCKLVIDSLMSFCELASARPAINFTGGDPLLRHDFFEILEYASAKNVRLSVMGNPFHLNAENITRMQRMRVSSYQVSLDGMEKIHDSLRMSGSFSATVDAIKFLKKWGMRTVVMFTLTKKNCKDLPDVMRLVDSLEVDAFAFARMARNPTIDTIISPEDTEFTPSEYRELLVNIQELTERLKAAGSKTKFSLKDHLWKLLLYEQGKLKLEPNPGGQICSGCHVGGSNLTILADGTVFACRRFNSPVGKVPEQSILEVFTSDKLDFYRKVENFGRCAKCPLLYHCRGCPAVAYGASGGNFYAADPQCWQGLDVQKGVV